MEDILEQIVRDKRLEVAAARAALPLEEVRAAAADMPPVRSLRRSLEQTPGGVIAEFKRRSPSKGWIKREARIDEVVPAYERAGAAALSVLTDRRYFGGSLQDVADARPLTRLPILRKDFVTEAYQLYEARAAGADACLLIVAAIGARRCRELAAEAHDIGLEVLLEVHGEEEVAACSPCVDIIGVNNRNLKAFRIDPAQSERLYPRLPAGPLPVSESGLLDPLVALRLSRIGFRGFLVGEAFMRAEAPGKALELYLRTLTAGEQPKPV